MKAVAVDMGNRSEDMRIVFFDSMRRALDWVAFMNGCGMGVYKVHMDRGQYDEL